MVSKKTDRKEGDRKVNCRRQEEYDPLYPIKRTFQAGRMAEMKSKEFQREIQSEIKEKSKGNPKEVQR